MAAPPSTSTNPQKTTATAFQVGGGPSLEPSSPTVLRITDGAGALQKLLAVAPVAFARLPANQGANVALAWADLQTEAGLSRAASVWTRTEGIWRLEAKLNVENTSILSLGVLTWTATGNSSGTLDQGVLSVPLGAFGQITLQALFRTPDTTCTLALSASIGLSNFSIKAGSSAVFTRIG